MTSAPLDYVQPDTPRRRRRPWHVVGAVAVVASVALLLPGISVRQVESRIDTVTGSVTWTTTWPLGIHGGTRTAVSPLEARLKAAGIPWTPDPRFIHNTHRNVFGGAIKYECSSAPPVYSLRPMLHAFCACATDGELREFVRVMQSGSDAQQRAAVDAAADRALAPPPGHPCG
jgi:hypothetical protein